MSVEPAHFLGVNRPSLQRALTLFLLASLNACLFGISNTWALVPEKPNIILILADDVGYEALSCYGGESYATPNIDALAASGLKGMHCYSMPVCHPTRIALLTGKYPSNIGNPKWGTFPVDLENQCLAIKMKSLGYSTAVAGKWQLALLKDDVRQPQRMGFDDYCVFGWHEGPRYHEPLVYENGAVNSAAKMRFGPDLYREFLESFIAASEDQGKPSFVYYSMALCHDVTDDLEQPVPVSPSGKYLSYAEMVAEMDHQIGLLVRFLEEKNLRQKTLLIFTADNGTPVRSISHAVKGEYIREPIFSRFKGKRIQGGKGRLDDTGTRVPLILNWPTVIEPSGLTDALVDMTDFFATFVQLGGGKGAGGIDGVSFLPLVYGKQGKRRWAYSEGKGKWWVRDQRYKLFSDGLFVRVDQEMPGREVELSGMLDSEQVIVREMLKQARPLRETQ